MTFRLDTTGYIIPTADLNAVAPVVWDDLDAFTQGYIEAAMAALDSELRRDPGRYLDGGENVQYIGEELAFHTLAPETLARIIADCVAMVSGLNIDDDAGGGRLAWSLRQSGWKGWGTTPRKRWPPLSVQLGDDSKVRFA